MILDVQQTLQDRGVMGKRHLERLEMRLRVLLGVVAQHFDLDCPGISHARSLSFHQVNSAFLPSPP